MNNYEFIVSNNDTNKRIDIFLSEQLTEFTRSYLKKLIIEENISVNDKIIKSNYKLKLNDIIKVIIPNAKNLEIKAQNISLDILYEDNDIIVINKSKGMVVHPAAGNYEDTLVNALLYHCKENLSEINGVIRPGIVHRIDKDTSGVLVVAKNNSSHLNIASQIKEHTVNRKYWAIVHGNIKEATGTIDAAIGRHPVDRKKMAVIDRGRRREAVTHFKVIEHLNKFTLIEAKLETGRTHQIRVHMSYINHPVLGDQVYGPKNEKYILDGQILHAKTLGFIHPTKNMYMEFEAPLPNYFEVLLKKLRN